MAVRTVYICGECGATHPKWTGQCQDCGTWNSLSESLLEKPGKARTGKRFDEFAPPGQVQKLVRVDPARSCRIASGLEELDRVLGGGLVPGSVVLLGGDPGIGKSTLLLQALSAISEGLAVLYITGEESSEQIALRARRLGVVGNNIDVLTDTSLERSLEVCQANGPQVLVIDSIQTFYSQAFTSAPGSVTQVRETAAAFVRFAKQSGCVVFLVGHVTKEGSLAGPRILEHMVDTVLYFEGDRSSSFRLVRGIKNRFGAVNEIGVFAMTDAGLKEVSNPSAMFISRQAGPSPGSVVLAAMEGTRPMLVEVQALVDRSPLSNPRRLTVGLDAGRLAMILAVLHRHAGCMLYDNDVFVNVIGGVRVTEPAADLAIALAVLSSFRDEALPEKLAVFGEIGLTGEVRPVQRGQQRIQEAVKLGFRHLLIPKANAPKTRITDNKPGLVTHISRIPGILEELE